MYYVFQESLFPSGCSWLGMIWLPPCETSTRSSLCATTWTLCWSTRKRGATSNSRWLKTGLFSAQLFWKFQLMKDDLACVWTVRCVATFVGVPVFSTVHRFCMGFKSGLWESHSKALPGAWFSRSLPTFYVFIIIVLPKHPAVSKNQPSVWGLMVSH